MTANICERMLILDIKPPEQRRADCCVFHFFEVKKLPEKRWNNKGQSDGIYRRNKDNQQHSQAVGKKQNRNKQTKKKTLEVRRVVVVEEFMPALGQLSWYLGSERISVYGCVRLLTVLYTLI